MLVDHTGEREHASVQERAAQLSALLDAAFDGTLISEDGRIVGVSQRLLDLSGYTRDEVLGRPLTDFVAPEFHETIRQRQAKGVEGRLDAVSFFKDGRKAHVEIVTTNHVRDGRTIRITAMRDVTERRRLEEQFRQAQKMEALGRLSGGIAHDINNLLSVMRLYAEILLQELDDPHRGDAREIMKAVDSGAALTRQLLAFSRQDATKPMSLDVNGVVRDCEMMLRRLLGTPIELVAELDETIDRIRGNPVQLQQVIVNLAINARDAMPHGGRIVVRTRHLEVAEAETRNHPPARPGRYVMLSVSDSGPGIPDDVQAQIFDPFYTTKDAGRGTGLGLSIVQNIVELAGGFIVVDSTVAVGTTFAIYFPVVDG